MPRVLQEKFLSIDNFKSIKSLKIKTSRINIFIGKPNSGKSNFLEAMSLFNEVPKNRSTEPNIIRYNTLDNLFYDRNLDNDIRIKFESNLAMLSYYSETDQFVQTINPSEQYSRNAKKMREAGFSFAEIMSDLDVTSAGEVKDKFSSFMYVLNNDGKLLSAGGGKISENPIRRYEFKERSVYSDKFSLYLKNNGENLFTIVQKSHELRDWINSFYEEYRLEFLIDFSSKQFEIQKKERGIAYKIPFELTPDTFRRMLFHVAAIYSNNNSTILLEEPESHSFPPYIKELSELIKADKKNTYFITTHSPYFFNSMIEDSNTLEDISFFHVYYDQFETKIKKLNNSELDNLWGNGADVFFNIDSIRND